MIRTLLLMWAAVVVLAQQPPAPPSDKPPSVTISVVSEATGAPVPNATVTFTGTTGNRRSTMLRTTDSQGFVRIENLVPAQYTVTASANGGLTMSKNGELSADQNLSVQMKIPFDGQISGRILDQNSDPLPNIAVYLITREYAFESLRYIYSATTKTNDKGEYLLEHAHPGISYLLLAAKEQNRIDTVSSAPVDPKFRRPVMEPTYYPSVSSPEGALVLQLRDSERRENVDIRLARSANYCVEGTLSGSMHFELREKWPVNVFLVGRSASGVSVPSGVIRADGKIRICDLHPGDYELAAYPAPAAGDTPDSFSRTMVSIGDHDLNGLTLTQTPKVSIPGEMVWDGAPPATAVTAKPSITISPLTRAFGRVFLQATIPGSFTSDLFTDDYGVEIRFLTAGGYVKDVEYGGRSVLHQVLHPGTAAGDASLRVVLAMDGGTIAVTVADKDGNPIPDLNVVVMPKNAGSEAALSAGLVTGQANGNGVWTSPTLAPGQYYALATSSRVDMSPESIARILRARDRATEIDLPSKSAPRVTLSPVAID